jgi:hypothetical protein
MKLKNRKIYFALLFLVIVAIISMGALWILLKDDSDSAINLENQTNENSNLGTLTPEEALGADYVVYYSHLRYVLEYDESAYDDTFGKDYWEIYVAEYGASCYGEPQQCYWVPTNSGIVEKDLTKKIELALEKVASIVSEVNVSEENGKFIVEIDGMISSGGDSDRGEVESIIKTIELYTKNYEIYYKGEKGFDKFYDTFPKGG